MKINKQLFEDVLSGKLKGTFVLSNDITVNSDKLFRAGVYHPGYAFRGMSYIYDCNGETPILGCSIVDFIPDTDMKQNELMIEIPNDKIVDWDESKKQNKIVLKNKRLTYNDIIKHAEIGSISNIHYFSDDQMRCLLAKNRLANVAKYLNDGWKPDIHEPVYCIVSYVNNDNKYSNLTPRKEYFGTSFCSNNVIFKSEELAQQAIEILGEETVKLALEPLGI